MGLPAGAMKIVSIIVLVMLAIFWIVTLAGVASEHKNCVDAIKAATSGFTTTTTTTTTNTNINNANQFFNSISNLTGRRLLGRQLLTTADDICSNQFSFPWWIVWFEFFIIVGAFVLAFGLIANFKMVVCAFMIVNLPLLMYEASIANGINYGLKDTGSNDAHNAVQTVLAGLVGLCLFNIIYLVCQMESSGAFAINVKGGACGGGRGIQTHPSNPPQNGHAAPAVSMQPVHADHPPVKEAH